VFAQTTHVVAAPHGFACVVIPAARLYIPSVVEIRSGVSEPQGVKICPFPLLWLVAFTTACTTVQAVIIACTQKAYTPSDLTFLQQSAPEIFRHSLIVSLSEVGRTSSESELQQRQLNAGQIYSVDKLQRRTKDLVRLYVCRLPQ